MIRKIRYEAGDREGWLKLRNSMDDCLGGSEIGAAANNSQYSSFFKLLCQRVGLIETPDISGKMAVKLGVYNEPFVAQEFARVSGKKVHCENCVFVNDDFPHLKATIDRKIANEDSGLECKFMSDMVMRKYKRGDFPVAYKDQCTSYLAVTNFSRWYLAIVTNNRLFVFLMTRIKEEEERFLALRAKFGFTADETDPDYEEWKTKWSYLESVYYLDEEEMEAAEIVAAHFIKCVEEVKSYMEGREFRNDEERKAFLMNAVYQVVDPADIDGGEATTDTIAATVPPRGKDAPPEVDINPESEDGRAFSELIAERNGYAEALKDLNAKVKAAKEAISEFDNKIAFRIAGRFESGLIGDWRLDYKFGSSRRTCSVEAVEKYFTSKGEAVPDGMINVSTPSRSVKVTLRAKKACKPHRKAA